MKRFLVALTALIASLAIGLATVSTTAGAAGGDHVAQVAKKKCKKGKKKCKKKKKKFAATISLNVSVTAGSTYSAGVTIYSGVVSSGGPAGCTSGRAVTITRNGVPVVSVPTNAGGSYSVTVNADLGTGQYGASTSKRVIKKKGKKPKKGKKKKRKKQKVICKGAVSATVAVP
jgi:hypothetical protein